MALLTAIEAQQYYEGTADEHGWGAHSGRLTREREGILDKLVVGESVLDVGCAHGLYVDHLAGHGLRAVGLDFVPEFIQQAVAVERRGSFAVGDALRLPFGTGSFDTVLFFDILEHVEDDRRLVAEGLRVARKRLLIIVPRTTDDFLARSGLVFRHHIDRTHLRTYSRESLRAVLGGLSVETRLLDRVYPLRAALRGRLPRPMARLVHQVLLPLDTAVYSELLAVVDLER